MPWSALRLVAGSDGVRGSTTGGRSVEAKVVEIGANLTRGLSWILDQCALAGVWIEDHSHPGLWGEWLPQATLKFAEPSSVKFPRLSVTVCLLAYLI